MLAWGNKGFVEGASDEPEKAYSLSAKATLLLAMQNPAEFPLNYGYRQLLR
jgi:hypothetical protein